MSLEKAKQHIHQWVQNTLSVPSPLFNNFPPCPYSQKALLENKVDICWVHGANLLAFLAEIGKMWDDSYEIAIVACEPHTISVETLIDGMETLNNTFEANDLVSIFDHPHCTNPKYKVTSSNGKYVLVTVQRLSVFVEAAKPLYKKGYFKQVDKEILTSFKSYSG